MSKNNYTISNVCINKANHISNGNVNNRIKLGHQNLGHGFLEGNKLSNLEILLSQNKPHILGISESDVRTDISIEGYTIEKGSAPRLNVLVSESIVYKRRRDLETPSIPCVWLEVGLNSRKKILICNVYREWKRQGDLKSKSYLNQLNRWNQFSRTKRTS